jgi:hypothetical protein
MSAKTKLYVSIPLDVLAQAESHMDAVMVTGATLLTPLETCGAYVLRAWEQAQRDQQRLVALWQEMLGEVSDEGP